MSTRLQTQVKAASAPAPSFTPVRPGLLQRKCACDGSPRRMAGECAECQKRRLTRRRESLLQTKLAINEPGDRFEQEADRVADQVMRMPESPSGHDFSQVRVHTDLQAAKSALTVNALAYTVGRDVVFGGQYATTAGGRVLAHELAHVIQQREALGDVQQLALMDRVSEEGLEHEAEAQAAQVVVGQRVGSAQVQGRLGIARLQRQADIGQAPPGLPCVLTVGPGHLPGTNLLFAVSSAALTARHRADITAFASSWTASGSRDDISVDGFASVEGPQAFNWRLSCDRAEAVKAELVRQGVPGGKITTFAHGESTEFSRTAFGPNRRALITTLPSTPTPTTPAPPAGPACTPRTGITEHGCYCGRGTSCPSGHTCPPIDALDACCQVHDICYTACPRCEFEDSINPLSSRHAAARACDMALCSCASGLTLSGRAATYRDRMRIVFRCP